jgi:hypothetical protein
VRRHLRAARSRQPNRGQKHMAPVSLCIFYASTVKTDSLAEVASPRSFRCADEQNSRSSQIVADPMSVHADPVTGGALHMAKRRMSSPGAGLWWKCRTVGREPRRGGAIRTAPTDARDNDGTPGRTLVDTSKLHGRTLDSAARRSTCRATCWLSTEARTRTVARQVPTGAGSLPSRAAGC